jgi:sec-independent protein translocase protein TatB
VFVAPRAAGTGTLRREEVLTPDSRTLRVLSVLNLDPGKLLVIAVVAIILLGPDRLPQVARQVGAAWRTFNEFRTRMESEVRSSIPDLPSSHDISRLARSPTALLDHLSKVGADDATTSAGTPEVVEAVPAAPAPSVAAPAAPDVSDVPDASVQPAASASPPAPAPPASGAGASAEHPVAVVMSSDPTLN